MNTKEMYTRLELLQLEGEEEYRKMIIRGEELKKRKREFANKLIKSRSWS